MEGGQVESGNGLIPPRKGKIVIPVSQRRRRSILMKAVTQKGCRCSLGQDYNKFDGHHQVCIKVSERWRPQDSGIGRLQLCELFGSETR